MNQLYRGAGNMLPASGLFLQRQCRIPQHPPSISMHRSSIYNLLHAATFALPDGHPVIDALNRACSSGLAGDMVRAKDAIAALLNHDPKTAEQLAFAYRTIMKGDKISRVRAAPVG